MQKKKTIGVNDSQDDTSLLRGRGNGKGVYRVSIVKRPLLSTLPYLVAFHNFIK